MASQLRRCRATLVVARSTRGYACHIPPPCQSFATFSCEGMGTPGNTSLQTLPQPLSPPPSTAALHDPVNESALLRVYVSRVNATPKHGDYEVGGTSAKLSGVLRECAASPSATASAGQCMRACLLAAASTAASTQLPAATRQTFAQNVMQGLIERAQDRHLLS